MYMALGIAASLALGSRQPAGPLLFILFCTTIHSGSPGISRYGFPIMAFAIVLASLWLSRPRPPEGRWRSSLVGLPLLACCALCVRYVSYVLP